MPVEFVCDDIVNRPVDAIVNAANGKLRPGGGVCGAIYQAAGYQELLQACLCLRFCQVGDAVVTPGFNLKAKYIIHAVGPAWRGGDNDEENRLVKAYLSALAIADEKDCESIAFPLISSGIYGVPKDIAVDCARRAFEQFPNKRDMLIELVFFDKESLQEGIRQLGDIRAYIDDRVAAPHENRSSETEAFEALSDADPESIPTLVAAQMSIGLEQPSLEADKLEGQALEDFLKPDEAPCATAGTVEPQPETAKGKGRKRKLAHLFGTKSHEAEELEKAIDLKSATFSETLLHMIDERGLTDPEVYHRANISRKLFSKIRSDVDYSPSKRTAVQLAIALDLNRQQADFLLRKAGFAFSPASEEDLIVCYFLDQGDCDIFRINEALFYFNQPLLCG